MEKIITVAALQTKINMAIKNRVLICSEAVCGSTFQTIKPSPASETNKEAQTP